MTGLILAWLTGEGILIYRTVTQQHRPPYPAELLGTSGLFVMLALLGEVQQQFASLLAWGLVAAAFMNLWPTTTTPTKTPPQPGKGPAVQ